MAKISRPIIYVALLGAVAYAAVVLTEPEATKKKKPTVRTTGAASATIPGFTADDMKASFPRYGRRGADAFAPQVIGKKGAATTGNAAETSVASWTLTGISVVDGVRSALLEQAGTGESVFLKAGQTWNGLTVQSIEPTAVNFVDRTGKTIRLAFAETEEARAVAPAAVNPTALTAGLPSQPGAAVIPPPAPGNAARTTR